MAKQLTLGELVERLEQCEQDADVYFDFCRYQPGVLDSYRGYYDHLALGYEESGTGPLPVSVKALLKMCKDADGRIFHGYKGGAYEITRRTPLWVENYGHSSGTTIADVADYGYRVILSTGYID